MGGRSESQPMDSRCESRWRSTVNVRQKKRGTGTFEEGPRYHNDYSTCWTISRVTHPPYFNTVPGRMEAPSGSRLPEGTLKSKQTISLSISTSEYIQTRAHFGKI